MANEVAVRRGNELAPRRQLPTLAREMDRLFSDFFGEGPRFLWPRWWSERLEGYQAPVVDVYEEKDDIVVKAELPGLTKDDLEVNVTDNQLTLKGEKKKKEEIKEDDYYCCERSFGSFSRVVDLPAEIQSDKAKASFKDGLLEIRVPKTEAAKKKQIKVKVD